MQPPVLKYKEYFSIFDKSFSFHNLPEDQYLLCTTAYKAISTDNHNFELIIDILTCFFILIGGFEE